MFPILAREENIAQTLVQANAALCDTEGLAVGQADFGLGGLRQQQNYFQKLTGV